MSAPLPDDDEPSGVHLDDCAVWRSADPTTACDCGAEGDER